MEYMIRRANIERSCGHQIFRHSINQSRDTVLQLAFGVTEVIAYDRNVGILHEIPFGINTHRYGHMFNDCKSVLRICNLAADVL